VEISLYGVNAITHEAVTQLPRSFALTLRAFRLLHDRGVRTVMKVPLMCENVRQLHPLESLAAELGATFHPSHVITAGISGRCSPLQHRISDEDLLWLTQETLDPSQWTAVPRPLDAPVCGIGQSGLVLSADGVVYPCVEVRQAAGSVRCLALEKIWRHGECWRTLMDLSAAAVPACRACALRSTCVRCPGIALLEEGSLAAPGSENCRAAAIRRRVLVEIG
jgi:radical SAM protein with 4Fe4S-binding SPASM domain